MRINYIASFLAAALISLVLSGCGGGGVDGGASSGTPAEAPRNTVGGTAAVGPILDAKVLVFRAGIDDANDDSKALNAATPASTDSTGKYSVDVGSYAGPLIVKVVAKTTSRMCDEVTGKCDLDMPANFKLRAALPSVNANTVAHVTPFTEIAASALTSDFSAGMINAANTAVRINVLGGLDPLTTKPVVDNSTAFSDAQRLEQKNMVLMLAAVNKTDADGTCRAKAGGEKIQCAVEGLRGMLTAVNTTSSTTDAKKLGALKDALARTLLIYVPTLDADGTLRTGSTAVPPTDADTKLRLGIVASISAGEHPLPSAAVLSEVDRGKAFFREQRAVTKLYTNGNGFLDSPSTRIQVNMNSALVPSLDSIKGRIDGVEMAVKFYGAMADNSWANNIGSSDGQYVVRAAQDTRGYAVAGKVWVTSSVYDYTTNTQRSCHSNDLPGTWDSTPYGASARISGGNASASAALTKVTCKLYTSSLDKFPDGSYFYEYLLLDEVKPTPGNASSFTFTARNYSGYYYYGGVPTPTSTQYLGSATLARNAGGNPAAISIDAWFPSTANGITKEHLKMDATSSANNATRRLDFSGLLAAYSGTEGNDVKSGDTLKSSFNFASGSYFISSLAPAAAPANSSQAVEDKSASAHVEVTIKVGTAQLVGSADAGSYQWDAGSRHRIPTAVTLNGAFSDTSVFAAGEILSGKFELAVSDYGLYDATQSESSSNYKKSRATFTGTLQNPSAPGADFTFSMARTGLDTATLNFNSIYSGGKTVAGSATVNVVAGISITLTNQDGISVTLTLTNESADMIVTLNNVTIAKIKSDGKIYYMDGAVEPMW